MVDKFYNLFRKDYALKSEVDAFYDGLLAPETSSATPYFWYLNPAGTYTVVWADWVDAGQVRDRTAVVTSVLQDMQISDDSLRTMILNGFKRDIKNEGLSSVIDKMPPDHLYRFLCSCVDVYDEDLQQREERWGDRYPTTTGTEDSG